MHIIRLGFEKSKMKMILYPQSRLWSFSSNDSSNPVIHTCNGNTTDANSNGVLNPKYGSYCLEQKDKKSKKNLNRIRKSKKTLNFG